MCLVILVTVVMMGLQLQTLFNYWVSPMESNTRKLVLKYLHLCPVLSNTTCSI